MASGNDRPKYLTSFKDRHGKRWFYFRYRRKKFKLRGKPGDAAFHEDYAQYLLAVERGTLGRDENLAYLKGSIGWVIERFITSDVGFGKLKPGSQRNYRRCLDMIKAEVGRFQIKDLTPNAVRAMRDGIKVKFASTTADMCVIVVSVLWKFAIEFCQQPLGHNPAHGVARVHTERKSREPWPDHVVMKMLAANDPVLRLALHLLLYTGQREGDVIRMKWDDIRECDDDGREICVVQEKTGPKVWVPLHRDLKALLDQTPRTSDFILNSSWGRLGKSHQPKPATANARLSCSRMILVMVRRRCEHLRLEKFSFRQKGLFVHRKGLPENLRHFEWRFRQCDGGMSMPFYGKVKSSSKSSRAKYWSSSGGLTGT